MDTQHEPLPTNPRGSEPERGDVLPLKGEQAASPRKTMAEKALHSTVENLENQPLDAATALWLLHKEIGFYGRDSREKDSMQGIMGRSAVGFPTLRYFDEVEYHQRDTKTKDPKAALRSLVSHFEGYAVQANTEVRFSRLFENTIADKKVGMDGTLAETFSMEDLMEDEPMRRTLMSLARLHEIDLFVAGDGEGKSPLYAKYGIDSLKDKAFYNRLFQLLGDMKFSEIMSLNERMIEEENKRFEYWKSRLREARMRGFLRGQVDLILDKLNALRPTVAS